MLNQNLRFNRNAGAIILNLAYGYSIKEESDPIVHLVEKAMDTLAAGTTPGAWFVDYFPILRFLPSWFPGGGFKNEAKWMKALVNDMAAVPYDLTKDKIVRFFSVPPVSNVDLLLQAHNVELPPNLITDCLDTKKLDPETEYNIKWAAASIYSGKLTCQAYLFSNADSKPLLRDIGGADTVRLYVDVSLLPH